MVYAGAGVKPKAQKTPELHVDPEAVEVYVEAPTTTTNMFVP